jgi:hypothetical protein
MSMMDEDVRVAVQDFANVQKATFDANRAHDEALKAMWEHQK